MKRTENEWQWQGNQLSKVKAEEVANNLNELAKDGNQVMNCCFYEYKADEPPEEFRDIAPLDYFGNHILNESGQPAQIWGVYRKFTPICRHCGELHDKHGEPTHNNPCGINSREKSSRVDAVMPASVKGSIEMAKTIGKAFGL